MSDEFHQGDPEISHAAVRSAASERTGLPSIDAVLEKVESVAQLPVSEQVGVFERAHDELRRALDAVDAPDTGDVGNSNHLGG